jgi:hypothetical protein
VTGQAEGLRLPDDQSFAISIGLLGNARPYDDRQIRNLSVWQSHFAAVGDRLPR